MLPMSSTDETAPKHQGQVTMQHNHLVDAFTRQAWPQVQGQQPGPGAGMNQHDSGAVFPLDRPGARDPPSVNRLC